MLKTWVHIILILFQRTTFQAVLISGGQSTFVLMNYGEIASTTRDVQVRCGRSMIYRWPLLPDMMQEWMYYCRHKSFLFVHLQCMHSQLLTCWITVNLLFSFFFIAGWLRYKKLHFLLCDPWIIHECCYRCKLKFPQRQQRKRSRSLGFPDWSWVKRLHL